MCNNKSCVIINFISLNISIYLNKFYSKIRKLLQINTNIKNFFFNTKLYFLMLPAHMLHYI